MSTGSQAPAANGDSSWLRQEAVIDAFEAAWQEGGAPDLGAFLPPPGDDDRTALLLELVKVDLEYRWAAGDRRTVETYAAAHSALAELPAELIAAEVEVRRYHRCPLEPAEWERRFPGRAAELSTVTTDPEPTDHHPTPVGDPPRQLGRY